VSKIVRLLQFVGPLQYESLVVYEVDYLAVVSKVDSWAQLSVMAQVGQVHMRRQALVAKPTLGVGVGISVGLLCLSLIYCIHIITGPQFLAGFPPEMRGLNDKAYNIYSSLIGCEQ
jgi:hypothetical protein